MAVSPSERLRCVRLGPGSVSAGVALFPRGGAQPGVDLSAYRIVQEALTNVVRHAAPATAEPTLRYRPAEVVIEITTTAGLI